MVCQSQTKHSRIRLHIPKFWSCVPIDKAKEGKYKTSKRGLLKANSAVSVPCQGAEKLHYDLTRSAAPQWPREPLLNERKSTLDNFRWMRRGRVQNRHSATKWMPRKLHMDSPNLHHAFKHKERTRDQSVPKDVDIRATADSKCNSSGAWANCTCFESEFESFHPSGIRCRFGLVIKIFGCQSGQDGGARLGSVRTMGQNWGQNISRDRPVLI